MDIVRKMNLFLLYEVERMAMVGIAMPVVWTWLRGGLCETNKVKALARSIYLV